MKKKAIFLITATLIAGIAGSIFYSLGDKEETSIITSGFVEGTEVNISSKVPGKISVICCIEGDTVRKGDTVIKLESDELEAAVKQAEAAVARAGAEIKVAESAIENARANIQGVEADIKNAAAGAEKARVAMEEAKREMERAKMLYAEEVVSREAFEKATAGYDISSAENEASNANLAFVRAKRDSAAAQLDTSLNRLTAERKGLKEAEANLLYHKSRLNDTVIVAPISGTVLFRAFEEGETVSAGITMMTVVDLDNLYVRADLDETRIGSATLGKEVDIFLEHMPDSVIRGSIAEIGRYAEFATQRDVVRGRQDIRTFRVKIRVGDHGGALKPGMTVTVKIPE